MYGVNMDKPGAQAYYNGVIDQLAGWGVDFIRYADILHKPREIEAVADAIAQCGRDIDIVLSFSPGDAMTPAPLFMGGELTMSNGVVTCEVDPDDVMLVRYDG